MNIKEFRSMQPMIKKSKYNNTKVNGYDSRKESQRATTLQLMQKAGIISDLQEQVKFELIPSQYVQGFNGKHICARRSMIYIADFTYIRDRQLIIEDCKGFKTATYLQKKRLMKRILNIEILET